MTLQNSANITSSGEKLLSSMHNHCTFCDGANTPMQMAQKAYSMGITDFGMSSHSSPTSDWCIGVNDDNLDDYIKIIDEVKRSFKGKMRVYTGVEQDIFTPLKRRKELDYFISGVHEIYCEHTGLYYAVDCGKPVLERCARDMFGGDMMELVRHFYKLSVESAQLFKPDIIAHFDIIIKANTGNCMFDEDSKQYKDIALEALDACIETGGVIEINTGGIYRGYRQMQYPYNFLLKHLKERHAPVTISSDAHRLDAVGYKMHEMEELMRTIGFKEVMMFKDGAFVPVAL